jgi:prolycopene isomerase
VNTNQFEIIAVGAGPGGVTAASLLANSGKRVLLLDKNPKPGGRMMTIQRDGFSYELFPINCIPQHNSLFEKLSKTLGKQNQVTPIYGDDYGIGRLYYEDKAGRITSAEMGYKLKQLLGFPGLMGVKLWQFRSLFRMARVLKKLLSVSEKGIQCLYGISAMDYFDSLGPVPSGFRTFVLGSFGEGAFEMTSDRVAAGEMIKMFQLSIHSGSGRYYEGGVGHFFEVMAQAVEENGGALRMNTRVAAINTESGRVAGVTTQSGETFFAPIVVSNAGIRQTVLKLVGEEHFEPAYTARMKNLENNLACVGYRYFTSKPVLNSPMMVLFPEGSVAAYREFEELEREKKKPESGYIYLGTTSLYPNMAPAGKQVIYAVASCLPDIGIDPKPYLEYIEEGVRKFAPHLYEPGVIEKTEVMTPAIVPGVGNDSIFPGQGGESYGIANSIGQAGPERPEAETPIDGLYVVGNDAAGFGLGTHQAVDSGFIVFDKIMQRLGDH